MPRKISSDPVKAESDAAIQVAADIRRSAEPAVKQANKFMEAAKQIVDPDVKGELERRANVRMSHALPRLKVAEHLESYARKGGEKVV